MSKLMAIRTPSHGKWHLPDNPDYPLNSDPKCRSAWAFKYEAERLSVLPPSALCRRCFPTPPS